MLAPWGWWDHTSQWIRIAFFCSLLKAFHRGLQKQNMLFEYGKLPCSQQCWTQSQTSSARHAVCHKYQMVLENSFIEKYWLLYQQNGKHLFGRWMHIHLIRILKYVQCIWVDEYGVGIRSQSSAEFRTHSTTLWQETTSVSAAWYCRQILPSLSILPAACIPHNS
jgi:hypothetical protein